MERRLAAILAADVVGYTRLMGADEEGTLRRLTDLREKVLEPLISEHRGRIVKLIGDGLLAEFASAVDSVACAVAWQNNVARLSADENSGEALLFRIGINLGDVIVEDGDIHGDGVNIAARLEGLAKTGGICVSGDVFRHAKGKLEAEFEYCGEKNLKNVTDPVQIYMVTVQPPVAQTGNQTTAFSVLPQKPTIAVLPFVNMSTDPEQKYFSDGITDDIITELSRFPQLLVAARHLSSRIQRDNIDLKNIAETLHVQYVVDGSVRRAGTRVRITVQLTETETGNHVWAERYDREFEDIFAVQDEVTRSIVGVLPGRVESNVAERASRKPTNNMKAYELNWKGKSVRDGFSAEGTQQARHLFERAIALDPRFARAHMYLADTYFVDLLLGIAEPDAAKLSLLHARQAASIDSTDIGIKDQVGFAYICTEMWEDAEAQFDMAVSQVTHEAEPMNWIGYGLLMLGRAEEARKMVLEAKKLNPLHPPSFDWVLGQACYFAKRYDDAIRSLNGEALLNSFAHACLVGAYAYGGRNGEARRALQSFIEVRHEEFKARNIVIQSDTIDLLAGGYRKMWRREQDWRHLAEGLRLAGLPD